MEISPSGSRNLRNLRLALSIYTKMEEICPEAIPDETKQVLGNSLGGLPHQVGYEVGRMMRIRRAGLWRKTSESPTKRPNARERDLDDGERVHSRLQQKIEEQEDINPRPLPQDPIPGLDFPNLSPLRQHRGETAIGSPKSKNISAMSFWKRFIRRPCDYYDSLSNYNHHYYNANKNQPVSVLFSRIVALLCVAIVPFVVWEWRVPFVQLARAFARDAATIIEFARNPRRTDAATIIELWLGFLVGIFVVGIFVVSQHDARPHHVKIHDAKTISPRLAQERTLQRFSKIQENDPPKIDRLCRVVQAGDFEHVKQLLDAKVDPNAKDSNGRVPLAIAVRKKDVNIIGLLLRRGADTEAKDGHGKDVHDVLEEQNCFAMMTFVHDLSSKLKRANDVFMPLAFPDELIASSSFAEIARDVFMPQVLSESKGCSGSDQAQAAESKVSQESSARSTAPTCSVGAQNCIIGWSPVRDADSTNVNCQIQVPKPF